MITDTGCALLATAVKSNPSHLRELDLTYNHPGEAGMKLLLAELQDPLSRLECLRSAMTSAWSYVFRADQRQKKEGKGLAGRRW